MLCISIWVLHTDYYDQSAAQSSSGSRLYQRHVTRVPLSVQTYDSVVKVQHGFSLIPRQLVVCYRKTPMHCLTVVWKRCRDAWGFAYMLTFAFMHASSLPCLHTFWHAIPTSFYILMFFLFSCIFRLQSTKTLQFNFPMYPPHTAYSHTLSHRFNRAEHICFSQDCTWTLWNEHKRCLWHYCRGYNNRECSLYDYGRYYSCNTECSIRAGTSWNWWLLWLCCLILMSIVVCCLL